MDLEIAMSISKMNTICDYQTQKMFLGHEEFRAVISREEFMGICSMLRFYPHYDHDMAVQDPVWYSRIMFERFRINSAHVFVPPGVMSFDERTIRCKGYSSARNEKQARQIWN